MNILLQLLLFLLSIIQYGYFVNVKSQTDIKSLFPRLTSQIISFTIEFEIKPEELNYLYFYYEIGKSEIYNKEFSKRKCDEWEIINPEHEIYFSCNNSELMYITCNWNCGNSCLNYVHKSLTFLYSGGSEEDFITKILFSIPILFYDDSDFNFGLLISAVLSSDKSSVLMNCVCEYPVVSSYFQLKFVIPNGFSNIKSEERSCFINNKYSVDKSLFNDENVLLTCKLLNHKTSTIIQMKLTADQQLFNSWFQVAIGISCASAIGLIIIIVTYCLFVNPFKGKIDLPEISSTISLSDKDSSLDLSLEIDPRYQDL